MPNRGQKHCPMCWESRHAAAHHDHLAALTFSGDEGGTADHRAADGCAFCGGTGMTPDPMAQTAFLAEAARLYQAGKLDELRALVVDWREDVPGFIAFLHAAMDHKYL